MWTTVRSLALLAVAVPATAYIVLETVVDESATPSRPVVVLEEASGTQRASGAVDAAGGDRPSPRSPGSSRSMKGPSCDDDWSDDDLSAEDRDDDAGDDVPVVRPCPTDVREDDPDDRDDDFEDD